MVEDNQKVLKASKKLSKLVNDCNKKVEELELENEQLDSELQLASVKLEIHD